MNIKITDELRQKITVVLLENSDLSLTKIANAIDVSKATVSRIHNGTTKTMDPQSYAKLIYFLENHKELFISSPDNVILDLNTIFPTEQQRKAVTLTLQKHAVDKVRESMQKQLDEKDLQIERISAQSTLLSKELLECRKEINRFRKRFNKIGLLADIDIKPNKNWFGNAANKKVIKKSPK